MSSTDVRPEASTSEEAVARYKTILRQIIDNRPSGTRQRLAGALGTNRSFISQITNPSYATPIPAPHIETIFEICHFSPEDRRRFHETYAEAHPRRQPTAAEGRRVRPHTIYLPDLGSEARNQEVDQLVGEFIQRLARLIDRA
jgi:hypothetical protein